MRNMSLVECLNFLFQLSFSTLGKDYTTDGLNNHMLKFLQHLREFGLVYQRKRKELSFLQRNFSSYCAKTWNLSYLTNKNEMAKEKSF